MSTETIAHKLDVFCAWHKVTRSARVLQTLTFSAITLMAALVLTDKLFWIDLNYLETGQVLAGTGLIILLGYFLLCHRKQDEVSYLIDREAGLKNLIGSSLEIDTAQDEVTQLVQSRAHSSLATQKPSKIIPLRSNWAGRYLYIPAALMVAALILPKVDFLQRSLLAAEEDKEETLSTQSAIKLKQAMKSVEATQTTPAESIDGSNIQKEFQLLPDKMMGANKEKALSELGEFENKYARKFEQKRAFDKLARALEEPTDMTGIPLEVQKDLNKLAQGLQEGNFKDAAEAMQDLAKRLMDENTPATEKQALARELQKLVKQMQGNDAQKQEGEDGQNGNQPQPADKLAQMLKEMQAQGIDMEDLMQQAKAAGGDMQQMAEMMEEMQAMQAMKDAIGQAKKDLLGEDAVPFDSKQFEEMMKQEANAAANGQGQPGQGQPGQGQPGPNQRGQGGGTPDEIGNETGFADKRSKSKVGEGRILHQIFVKGVPEKGEASVDYQKVSRAARQEAANSLAQDKIPREYEDMVKQYFNSLDLKNAPSPQD